MNKQPPVDDVSGKNARHALAFLAVLLALIGQIFVSTAPPEDDILRLPAQFWIPLGVTIIAAALLVAAQALRPSRLTLALFGATPSSGPGFGAMLALALSFLSVLLMVVLTKYARTTYIPAVIFWLMAGLCYTTGFMSRLPSRAECLAWIKLHRYELLGIGLLTLLALVLRFYQLGNIPRVVNGDEGRVGITAQSTNIYPYVNPFALWENFGGLYLQSINVFLSLFGASPFSLRLVAAIGGTLAIPALYLLARQIAGHRIALIAAGFLAISHAHLHFSRTVAVAYIQGTWLIPLELYFLLSGLERRSSWRTALAGVLLAIHFSIYLDSQIVTGLILVFMLIAFLVLRPWFKPALSQALVFWGGFGIMILPEAVHAWQQPAEFLDRLNNNGTFQSGWLQQAMADTGLNNSPILAAVELLGGRVVHAFLSLSYYPSFDFYGAPIPNLDVISACLFMLGLGMILWKIKAPGYLLLNGYFWAGTIAIGIFAIPASADTYRMLIVIPAAFLLAAIGLDGALHALGFGWASARNVYSAVTVLTLVVLLFFNLWTYYYDFAGRCRYGSDSPPARFASYLGNYVHTIDRESETFLLSDDTYFYGSHPSVDFLSGGHPITNVKESVDTLQIKPDETIIASPDRIPELRAWAESHPGGTLHYEYDCQNAILLADGVP